MSRIIAGIATETGILTPDQAEEIDLIAYREIKDQTAILRMLVGLAWDEYYIPRILGPQGVLSHPGEVCIDDVYGTPDGESISVIITSNLGNRLVVHEIKATWKSVNTVTDEKGNITLNESTWMWMAQIKAYCKALKTLHARLHVLFICGDYSRPIRPTLGPVANEPSCWEIEFTQKEVDDNWALLKQYKDQWLAGQAI